MPQIGKIGKLLRKRLDLGVVEFTRCVFRGLRLNRNYSYLYKGSGRGRLGAPRPPWRVRVECEEVFVLELSGTHELHTINTTYQVADVRPSGLR